MSDPARPHPRPSVPQSDNQLTPSPREIANSGDDWKSLTGPQRSRSSPNWGTLQETDSPISFQLAATSPAIFAELINCNFSPHDQFIRWTEKDAALILKSLLEGRGLSQELLELVTPIGGQFSVRHSHRLFVGNGRLSGEEEYAFSVIGRPVISPIVSVGVERFRQDTASPWLRISWRPGESGSLTSQQIVERWSTVSYAAHLAGELDQARVMIDPADRPFGPSRIGERCQIWTARRPVAAPLNSESIQDHLALHPDLIAHAALLRDTKQLTPPRYLTVRYMDLVDLLAARFGVEIAGSERPIAQTSRRGLRKLDAGTFIRPGGGTHQIFQVEGRLLIAGPRSTGRSLLSDFEALRRYEHEIGSAVKPATVNPVALKLNAPSRQQTQQLAVVGQFACSTELVNLLRSGVLRSKFVSPSDLVDQVLDIIPSGRSLTVEQSKLLEVSALEEPEIEAPVNQEGDEQDEEEEDLHEAPDEQLPFVRSFVSTIGSSGLPLEELGPRLQLSALNNPDGRSRRLIVDYFEGGLADGQLSMALIPLKRIEDLLAGFGNLALATSQVSSIDRSTGQRTLEIFPDVSLVIRPSRFDQDESA